MLKKRNLVFLFAVTLAMLAATVNAQDPPPIEDLDTVDALAQVDVWFGECDPEYIWAWMMYHSCLKRYVSLGEEEPPTPESTALSDAGKLLVGDREVDENGEPNGEVGMGHQIDLAGIQLAELISIRIALLKYPTTDEERALLSTAEDAYHECISLLKSAREKGHAAWKLMKKYEEAIENSDSEDL